MTVATDTTIVAQRDARGDRRSPRIFDRQVSWASGGMATSLAAADSQEAVPQVADVQA